MTGREIVRYKRISMRDDGGEKKLMKGQRGLVEIEMKNGKENDRETEREKRRGT